jgi:hypothetical protein
LWNDATRRQYFADDEIFSGDHYSATTHARFTDISMAALRRIVARILGVCTIEGRVYFDSCKTLIEQVSDY